MPDWTHAPRKAAKDHRCSTCGRIIAKGETYRRGAGFEGGTVWTWRDCAHCNAVLSLWYDAVADWDEGGYNADTFEAWVDYRGSAHDVTMDELRAMAGFRQRWRTKAGNLWPVPSITETRLGLSRGCAATEGEHRGPLIAAADGTGRVFCKRHWGTATEGFESGGKHA